MIPTEKFIIVQPTHHNGVLVPQYKPWGNDSFHNFSRLFQAPLYHINDIIDETADVYMICNFDIELIDKEIDFAIKMKARGAKILVGFSQDLRFLHGAGMMSRTGTLWTDLCEVTDGIVSGCSDNLHIYGRFQNKVIPMGEILEDNDFSIPYEGRTIDLLTSGATGEETISFETEFLLMLKEKYPEKQFVCCIRNGFKDIGENLQKKHPQITFATDPIPLIHFMQQSKAYCNLELRPRPARALMEAYYCRVPFISSDQTYYSNLCSEFTYSRTDFDAMVKQYDKLINIEPNQLISDMEERAKFDMFDKIYERIKEKIKL